MEIRCIFDYFRLFLKVGGKSKDSWLINEKQAIALSGNQEAETNSGYACLSLKR